MGCSSYVTVPDADNPSEKINLQFKYGFLREIQYELGDEIYWEKSEIPENVDTRGDAIVPAWSGDRGFALTIVANRLSGVAEIPMMECDRMYDKEIELFEGRHAWVKS